MSRVHCKNSDLQTNNQETHHLHVLIRILIPFIRSGLYYGADPVCQGLVMENVSPRVSAGQVQGTPGSPTPVNAVVIMGIRVARLKNQRQNHQNQWRSPPGQEFLTPIKSSALVRLYTALSPSSSILLVI